MARPIKYSIDYFPVMVNMDDDPKILLAEHAMGEDALAVYPVVIKLLGWIYGREGYFIEWTDTTHVIFAKKKFNIGYADTIKRVIDALISTGFFSKDMYEKHSILTSHGIQVQWKKVIDSVKGKATVNPVYDLVSSVKTVVSSEETQPNGGNIPQSKVNKSKVNESKLNTNLLSKGEEEIFSPGETGKGGRAAADLSENFMPVPENPPAVLDPGGRYTLDTCIEYIFQSGLYREELYRIVFTYNMKNEKGHFDYDKLYRWGLAFNRWQFKQNRNEKTLKNWHEHLYKWLNNQPLDANPDEINQPKDGQSNTKNQKLYGVDREEAGNFYNRSRTVHRNTGTPPPGTPTT